MSPPRYEDYSGRCWEAWVLFVGDDWAEDHHDIEIVDHAGRVLARRRLPEGLEGVTRLHASETSASAAIGE